MSEAIGMIQGSMRADAEALRIIGQNIANAEVTAYRRQIPLSAGGFDELVAASQGSDEPSSAARLARVAIDSQPGTLRSTGEALDVALEGKGFFVLQSASGPVLTRRGDFQVGVDGVLTAASGQPVLGENGSIQVGVGAAGIGPDGAVTVNGEIVDRLRIAQVPDETQLHYLGNGLYLGAGNEVQDAESYPVVRQGFLETANVTPVNEMVLMMETLRHFEAAQRLVRGYDQLLEKAISELGKVG